MDEAAREYASAWSEMMSTIFRDRLKRLVYSSLSTRATGRLLASVSEPQVEGDYSAVRYRFAHYGLFVDRGVGREKARGNSGDIGVARGGTRRLRESRRWFSAPWRRSLEKLAEELAERHAASAVRQLVDTME